MATFQYLPGHFVKVQDDGGKTIARAVAQVGTLRWVTTGPTEMWFNSESEAVEAMKVRFAATVLGV